MYKRLLIWARKHLKKIYQNYVCCTYLVRMKISLEMLAKLTKKMKSIDIIVPTDYLLNLKERYFTVIPKEVILFIKAH